MHLGLSKYSKNRDKINKCNPTPTIRACNKYYWIFCSNSVIYANKNGHHINMLARLKCDYCFV